MEKQKISGITLLLLSNATVGMTLLSLQNSFESPGARILLLSIGNLMASSALLSPRLTSRPIIPTKTRHLRWFPIYATAYSLIYGLFAAFPAAVPLTYIGCAQAIAPVIAAYIFEGYRLHAMFKMVLDALAVGIVILFLITRSGESTIVPPGGNIVVVILIIGYITSQFAARQLASVLPAASIVPRLAFLNGLFLLPIAIIIRPELGLNPLQFIACALMLGCALLIIQVTMFAGFQRTRPALSGVIVATNMPLFFIIEDLWLGRMPSITSAVLAASIVCVIGFRAATKEQ